jgi:hypothetical protein
MFVDITEGQIVFPKERGTGVFAGALKAEGQNGAQNLYVSGLFNPFQVETCLNNV